MATNHTAAVRKAPNNDTLWDGWFRAIYPRVYYIVFRKTRGDANLSEELTQGAIERFLRYRAYEKVTTDAESVSYLTRIALRLLVNEYRTTGNLEPLPEETLAPDAPAGRLDLEQLAQHLSNEDRRLIGLLIEGRSVSEIADILGIRYSAAGVRIHRAKGNLKKIAAHL